MHAQERGAAFGLICQPPLDLAPISLLQLTPITYTLGRAFAARIHQAQLDIVYKTPAMADELAPPRKSVELEDPGAKELGM